MLSAPLSGPEARDRPLEAAGLGAALSGTPPVLQSPRYDRPREQTLGRGHT